RDLRLERRLLCCRPNRTPGPEGKRRRSPHWLCALQYARRGRSSFASPSGDIKARGDVTRYCRRAKISETSTSSVESLLLSGRWVQTRLALPITAPGECQTVGRSSR